MKCITKLAAGALIWALLALGSAVPQQDPPAPDCCLKIFYTGYHLGMAAVLCSQGFIIDEFFDFMGNVLRFVQASNGSCSRINPAWPDWREKSNELGQYIDWLRRSADDETIRKVAVYLNNARASWGDDLMVQIVDSRPMWASTCEAQYFQLGYDLAQAQGFNLLASSSGMNDTQRNSQIVRAQQARDRALIAADNVVKIQPVTGRCASLGDLRNILIRWQANAVSARVALQNRAVAQEAFAAAESRLGNCQSTLGGTSGRGVAGFYQVVGRWTLYIQEYDGSSGQWTTLSTESVEFYNTQAGPDYLATEGVHWRLDNGTLLVWQPGQESQFMVLDYNRDGTWVGFAAGADRVPLRRDRRFLMVRAD